MIPGLTVKENWITQEEEKELLDFIYSQKWLPALSRRIQHYGFEYSYRPPYDLKPAPLIPELFRKYGEMISPDFNQVIVNEYLPGQGIGKHVDHKTLFGPVIASVSLGSATTMVFSYGETRLELYVEPRTLIKMEADSRWKWAHEIPARKSDPEGPRGTRVSLTFRTTTK